jgi:hypothetical protein
MKFNLSRGCYFCLYKAETHPMGWIWSHPLDGGKNLPLNPQKVDEILPS